MKRAAATALVILVCLTLAACGGNENGVWITYAGEYAVTRDRFLSYMLPLKDTWDGTERHGGELTARAVDYFRQRAAIVLWADALGVSLTPQETAAVDAEIQGYIQSSGGEKEYTALLAKGNMTRETYREYLMETRLEEKLYKRLRDSGMSEEQLLSEYARYLAAAGDIVYSNEFLEHTIADFEWQY